MAAQNFSNSLFNDKLWLLGIGAGLIAIHLTIADRVGPGELLSASLLYWSAVAYLIWQRRERLELESGWFSTLLGLSLVSLILIKSQALGNADFFLRLLPFLAALALALIASGIRGLKQYWQELLILSFLIPHSGLLSQIADISVSTARSTTVLLWYLGFDVYRQGVYVILPSGSVEVNPGCAGYSLMMQLLGTSVIFLVMFPTGWLQKIFLPIAAVMFGFLVNTVRVSIMAVLAASGNQTAFEYWHVGDGSLIFSAISITLLGLFCFLTLQPEYEK
ncbi:MAG: cyanoexosortase A [Leptolyngbyaceae cyanobacterium SM1_1_3]|nr:cyanoexosortase A [Leptolyngbyaceae cyanobacterium SM1_1_3]NJN03098.1 cyanoexosortase A [Leptolyngbyaceae cyanobacterium RM1_1_2]